MPLSQQSIQFQKTGKIIIVNPKPIEKVKGNEEEKVKEKEKEKVKEKLITDIYPKSLTILINTRINLKFYMEYLIMHLNSLK